MLVWETGYLMRTYFFNKINFQLKAKYSRAFHKIEYNKVKGILYGPQDHQNRKQI